MTDEEARLELMEAIVQALANKEMRWSKSTVAEGSEWVTTLELVWREEAENAAIASAWEPYSVPRKMGAEEVSQALAPLRHIAIDL